MMEYDWSSEQENMAQELDALDRQKKRREQTPLLYCRLVSASPVKAFLLALSGHILMIVISASLVASGYDLLPISFEDVPMYLRDRPWGARYYALQDKNDYDGYYDRTPTAGLRTRSSFLASLDLYYDADDTGGNVFIKSALERIRDIETDLLNSNQYEEYCQIDSKTTQCTTPMSIINFFDGTYARVNSIFNDTGFDNIPEVLYEAKTNNVTKKMFTYFLGSSYMITKTEARSWITRSRIAMGYPHKDYLNDDDGYRDHMGEYLKENFKPKLEEFRQNKQFFKFSYFAQSLWIVDVLAQAFKDVQWVGASLAFIFCFILFHTKSVWITGFAIISIVVSFVTANLIYIVVFGFKYLGFFHILALFIVLGIGADDVFVFYDMWRNTGCERYPSLAHRLSDTYRKSVWSMLFTSLTTSVAFLSSAITPLLATRSFGIFAALVIIVNYLSVILYFPTVVVMYHKYFEKFHWPCLYPCRKFCFKKSDSNNEESKESKYASKNEAYEDDMKHNDTPKEQMNGSAKPYTNGKGLHEDTMTKQDSTKAGKTTFTGNIHSTWKGSKEVFVIKHTFEDIPEHQDDAANVQASVYDVSEYDKNPIENVTNGHIGVSHPKLKYTPSGIHRHEKDLKEVDEIAKAYKEQRTILPKRKTKPLMVRFFRLYYFAFITHKVIRWILLLVLAAVLGFFIYQASTLEPDNELFDILPDDHVYTISSKHKLNSFLSDSSEEVLVIYIMWGLLQHDQSDCYFSEPKCRGEQRWDETFNPNTPEAQVALQRFCDKIQSMSDTEAYEFRLQKDADTGKFQVECFIESLDAFLKSDQALSVENLTLPFDKAKVDSFMQLMPTFYNNSFDSKFNNTLEIPISYWLSNKYTYNFNNDFHKFDQLIGEETGNYSTPIKTHTERRYGNNIKYLAITVNTTIKFRQLGHIEGIPIMETWENFVNAEMAKMPEGMRRGFQIDSRQRWRWLSVQEMLVTNAIYGLVIGVSLAFPILVIATGNIITGVLAAFSMCCSSVCVIGVIPLGGWKLGVVEALNMCMVVGLTVDYVVHLAEGYSLSLHKDRLSRVQDMLDEMAVAVFFGACTTLGASLFMFIAKLTFFFQFGIFIFSTIGFSLLFSMGLFATLLGMIGPENDTGNVKIMFQKLCGRYKNE